MNSEKQARQRIGALLGLFIVIGVSAASWVSRTPALRDGLQASTEQMGLVLFGFSMGSMLGILSANALLVRWHARRTIGVGMSVSLLGLLVLALAAGAGSSSGAFAGFALFGLGLGWCDIAVNVECAALEQALARPLMTVLHGCFSLGALLGALLGAGMAWQQVPVMVHLLGVGAVACVASVLLVPKVHNYSARPQPVEPSASHAQEAPQSGSVLQAFREPRVLWIGVFVLGLALAEGAAHDWLSLLMVDGYGFTAAQGTVIYMLFTLGMTVGRFAGHALLRRWDRATLMQASAWAAAAGLALVSWAQHPALGAMAVVLWGLGAALGFPLALSAAGDGPGSGAQRVGAVSILGYIAFLVGPPALGMLGERWGLRVAMWPVLGMALVAGLLVVWRGHEARSLQTAESEVNR